MINVSNAIWNKLSLPGILTSFAPFGVMNHKIEDLEWKCGLRMEGFMVRGCKEKQQWLCDHAAVCYNRLF